MNHHRILAGKRVLVPHPAVDLLGGKNLPRVAEEQVHDFSLRGGELHLVPIGPENPPGGVVAEPPVHQKALPPLGVDVAKRRVPPKLAPHPGDELLGVVGLGDIVVGPHGKAQDFVRVLALGGEDDHRQVPPLPDAEQGAEAVQPRHHHVDEDQLHGGVQAFIHGLETVVGPADRIALPLQGDGDGVHDFRVVVHD